ncbi:DC-STAMP domain-containing protein 2-like [Hyposmocoma kahamanoa]|uniref:DC-STAMP domain-containing protein 2-like n=1 Tax=Hyposmocoma kahamanoa TaxID=1477025 RepID=UPI000E6D9B65|nr:DC-STAMP domain-containing protein 2-like [Hyposmocoma kahamanoa]
MACGQEQIKTTLNLLNKFEERPLDSIKDNLNKLIDMLTDLTNKTKNVLVRVQRLVMTLAHSLQSGAAWLESVRRTCDHRVGDSHKVCINALKFSVLDCNANLGPRFNWLCNLDYVAEAACSSAKKGNHFCVPLYFVDNNILATVTEKLKLFTERVKSLLNLQVKVHRSYTFSSNASKSASQVAAGIVTEIRNRADPLLTWLSWSPCVTSLFLLLIIFRAKEYQNMFETRSRFDNRYMTKELRAIDLKRQKQGRDTVLPLNRREKVKYIHTTSFRLVSSEKFNLSRSVVFMTLTTFKLMIHMVADYSLYWVLMTIRYHGRFQSPINPGNPQPSLRISNLGLVSKIYIAILDALRAPIIFASASPVTCLPDPSPPDFKRYSQIGILIVMLWFFSLFEPYGLRLRHLIMGLYRPERAKTRAVWLYNHILRARGCFMKCARRLLHREYKYHTEERHTFQRWLDRHLPFWWLRMLLGTSPKIMRCLLCGTTELHGDPDTKLIRCQIPQCPGIYCRHCFFDIGELCTICLSPSDYGDMSDVSIEKGSSDDDSDSDDCDFEPQRKRTLNNDEFTTETNEKQSSYDKRSKKRWWAWPLEQETRFTNQFEEISSFDTFKDETICDNGVCNEFGDIWNKALKVRRKIYEQDIKQRETINCIQVKRIDNMMQSLKPESIDIANKSIDNKTKKFSTLSKRIQRDRQHCNDGDFQNHIKNDDKENKIATLNKIASNSNGRNQNYMIMNLEQSGCKPDYNMKPIIASDISANLANSHLKEMENSRKYRLATYLAEYDWKENHIECRNCLRTGLQGLLSISECEISIPCVDKYNNTSTNAIIGFHNDGPNDTVLEILSPLRKVDKKISSYRCSSIAMTRSMKYFKSLGLVSFDEDRLDKLSFENKDLSVKCLSKVAIKETQTLKLDVQHRTTSTLA